MKDITGTWRLVMTRGRTDTGEAMHSPYGPNPMALVEFQSNGRIIAVLCDGRPKLPQDEIEREYNSYCGNYTFDGESLITRGDAASDLRRLGGDEVRRVRFEGDWLVLLPPPRPWKGMTQHRELVWERIA
jgi:hypothetical protein